MKTLVIGVIVGALPVAVKWEAAYGEFSAGYNAYLRGRGPGAGRIRCAGWLQAQQEVSAEISDIQEARRSQF